MNAGRTIFAQLVEHLPHKEFQKCVARYRGDSNPRGFSCWDQYLAMAFAQLTYRESLRDIEACLGAMRGKLYHMGFRGRVTRSTLGDANEAHDWRIFADFALVLIAMARPLYADDPLGVDLVQALYALDSTTIDLCLSVFPWARFRKHKGAVKMHTLLDLRGNIPTFIRITDGKVHDVKILDELLIEAGAFYVMDRGYIDFERLHSFTLELAFFVVRTKENVLLQRRYSHPVDKSTGVRSDQTVVLATVGSASAYPEPLRRVSYFDAVTGKRLVFLTNNFTLPALTIAQIYKQRWQVELFFKWIKQHLRIKAFYGTSENAVKTQIWIAVSVYVLVAIVRKRLGLKPSLYQILQILSLTQFEKTHILLALQAPNSDTDLDDIDNQLILFDL
jgi:Transposase DDE domain.